VAQIGNLPFRQLAVGTPADCQSAIQQAASVRDGGDVKSRLVTGG
jgi:hypothetical protein